MLEKYGVKDLTRIVFRAYRPMKIGSRDIAQGEPVLFLDKAQVATVRQASSARMARGGRGNYAHIIWEDHRDLTLSIIDGVCSPIGYALITNLLTKDLPPQNGTTVLTQTDIVEVDTPGWAYTRFSPIAEKPIFIFNYKNGVIQEKIETFAVDGDKIVLDNSYAGSTILVDYSYYYGEAIKEYTLSKDRFNGLFSIEARFYRRSESGNESSNILTIPKVRIISDLSLRIGDDVAAPMLSTFNIVALSEETNGEFVTMNMLQLGEDVDSI